MPTLENSFVKCTMQTEARQSFRELFKTFTKDSLFLLPPKKTTGLLPPLPSPPPTLSINFTLKVSVLQNEELPGGEASLRSPGHFGICP